MKRKEKEIQELLARRLNADIEVQTPGGRIDILTKDFILEIKHISQYKAAIGQILAYGQFYPTHKKKLYLFGKVAKLKRFNIEYICNSLGVDVLFEDSIII